MIAVNSTNFQSNYKHRVYNTSLWIPEWLKIKGRMFGCSQVEGFFLCSIYVLIIKRQKNQNKIAIFSFTNYKTFLIHDRSKIIASYTKYRTKCNTIIPCSEGGFILSMSIPRRLGKYIMPILISANIIRMCWSITPDVWSPIGKSPVL